MRLNQLDKTYSQLDPLVCEFIDAVPGRFGHAGLLRTVPDVS
jgi:hypothetical protein